MNVEVDPVLGMKVFPVEEHFCRVKWIKLGVSRRILAQVILIYKTATYTIHPLIQPMCCCSDNASCTFGSLLVNIAGLQVYCISNSEAGKVERSCY